jgi:hypothetical protein
MPMSDVLMPMARNRYLRELQVAAMRVSVDISMIRTLLISD